MQSDNFTSFIFAYAEPFFVSNKMAAAFPDPWENTKQKMYRNTLLRVRWAIPLRSQTFDKKIIFNFSNS
jgi:hypothetical protein